VSNAGSESRTWSGPEGKPTPFRMPMAAAPRSHPVNRSRHEINVAQTIATIRTADEARRKSFGVLRQNFRQLGDTTAHRPTKDFDQSVSLDTSRIRKCNTTKLPTI
jgi:hypothetical protein